jgi:hypothetical protein
MKMLRPRAMSQADKIDAIAHDLEGTPLEDQVRQGLAVALWFQAAWRKHMMKLAFGSFIVGGLLTGYGLAGDYIKQKVGIATTEQAKMTEDKEQDGRLKDLENLATITTGNQKTLSDNQAITNSNVNGLSVEVRALNKRFDTVEGLLKVLIARGK